MDPLLFIQSKVRLVTKITPHESLSNTENEDMAAAEGEKEEGEKDNDADDSAMINNGSS